MIWFWFQRGILAMIHKLQFLALRRLGIHSFMQVQGLLAKLKWKVSCDSMILSEDCMSLDCVDSSALAIFSN
jgi:hypothetical protein